MNEKGMECLTNMKKEINENKFTFQMKAMDISILVKWLDTFPLTKLYR